MAYRASVIMILPSTLLFNYLLVYVVNSAVLAHAKRRQMTFFKFEVLVL